MNVYEMYISDGRHDNGSHTFVVLARNRLQAERLVRKRMAEMGNTDHDIIRLLNTNILATEASIIYDNCQSTQA